MYSRRLYAVSERSLVMGEDTFLIIFLPSSPSLPSNRPDSSVLTDPRRFARHCQVENVLIRTTITRVTLAAAWMTLRSLLSGHRQTSTCLPPSWRVSLSGHRLPVVQPEGPVEIVSDPYSACADSSAVLVLTDWDMFKNMKPIMPSKPAVQDGMYGNEVPPDAIRFPSHGVKPATPVKTSSLPAAMAEQLIAEPTCPADCSECTEARASGQAVERDVTTPLDWSAISQSVREPRWVFDGRGVLDFHTMTSLGFRLETLGRASMY